MYKLHQDSAYHFLDKSIDYRNLYMASSKCLVIGSLNSLLPCVSVILLSPMFPYF